MPLRKIREPEKVCLNPEHEPPKYIVLSPGVYEHECPGCHKKSYFEVPMVIA